MKNTLLFKHTKLGLLLAFVLFSSLGWGQTLYEDFNYTSPLNIGGATNSTSTAINNWATHSNTLTGTIPVNTGNLSYSGLQISTGSNIRLPGSNTTVPRDVNRALATNSASIAYYSALINVIDNTQLSSTADYFMAFGATNGTSVTLLGGRLGIKGVNTSNANYRLSIQNNSTGTPTFTDFATDLNFGTTYLVVVKYDRSTSPTTANLWVNPTNLGGTEPVGAVQNSSGTASTFTTFASICLRNSASTPKVDIDEIRVGTTWASVTPTAPSTTWNGSSWSNTTGPTSSIDAIIDGTYSTTSNGVFTAKSLIVNASKSFTLNASTNITVDDIVKNSGTFTIENNTNLVQTYKGELNTGSIIVNRNSSSIQLYDYTLWSSPVSGQKLKAFSPDTVDARFYSYNSDTNLYNVVPAPLTTDFATATGYLIRTPNTWTAATPTTFNGVFTGVPNNGDISVPGLVSGKYYAVGNPYPSTISVASFYTANPNAGTLYFWRKTNGATGTAYATRNNTGATASGGYTPSTDIAVGQGFFVSPSANMNLSFTNAMRATPSTSSVFLRTTEERNRFWLNLTNTTGLFSQMLVGYMPEATSGVDNAIDGRYINDAPTALTSIINAEEYSIQGRPMPFTTTDTVPLGFKTDAVGNYTIAIDHVDGLFSTGQTIYLKDNLLNTVVDLSAGSYSFASAIGTFNSRFEVHFQGALGVNNPTFTDSSVVAFGENGEIKINSGSTIMEHVCVYDLQGRLLAEKKQVNASETKIQTSATNQVLLVEITAANGSKITKKIIQ